MQPRSTWTDTGVALLWGTANLFAHPRYMAGAATNPDPEVFAYAAAQVAHCLEATHRLGGANYVLWGGREGYETLLNTDMARELDNLGRFLTMVVEHKHAIGFEGTILLEPKPQEPTKHQYDYDSATVHAFLQRYGLADEVKVNIEANHATLSGHDFAHEIAYAVGAGIFGSVDANRGDDRLGWDTDQFPNSVEQFSLAMVEILARRWVHHRRLQLRHQAAPPVHRPRRSVPCAHRRHGHPRPVAAGRRRTPRRSRTRRGSRRSLRSVGRRARPRHRGRREPGIAAPADPLGRGRAHTAVRPPGGHREPGPARHRVGVSAGATLVCGVDSSTQSTKVEIRRIDDGVVVATGSAPHPSTTPPRSEQDPESWWQALRSALAAAARTLGGLDDVAAISVAGQQHGMVLVGDDDRVLRPAKLWNDTESAPEAAELVARLGAAAWARRAGSVPVAAFTITKLAWVAAHEPDVLAATRRVMLPHDWLTWRLCGRHVTDRGDASGSGWWSPSRSAADVDLLELVDAARPWSDMIPTVLDADAVAGEFSEEGARRLGLPSGCVVAPGTGDNMAAALGLGLAPGDVVMSLGTSGTAYVVSDEPTADPTGAVAGFADATGRFLPLVCTLNATKVTDTIATLMGADRETFAELALAAPPGAGGLTLVPYLDGERTPDLPDASGTLVGLRTTSDRASLARAAHEGVVCGLLDGVDALVTAGARLDGRAFVVGGGARSAAYRQITADLWERPIRVPDDEEVVAAGACVQAAAVAGGFDPVAVAAAWGMGRGTDIDPAGYVDVRGIRAAYGAAARLSA